MTSNCAVKQSIGSSVIAFAKIFEMTVKQVHKHVRVGRRTQFCSSRGSKFWILKKIYDSFLDFYGKNDLKSMKKNN